MFDEATYKNTITIMRSEAATQVGAALKTRTNIATYQYTLTAFSDYGVIVLHIAMPNFYLQGIQVDNTLHVFYKNGYKPMGLRIIEMKFGETYANMGWDKSNSNTTVTLDAVNKAILNVVSGGYGKDNWKDIVVAFSEGFRFDKIRDKVCDGTPIGGKELDWSAPGATVTQG